MRETTLTFPSGDLTLAGTVAVPEGAGPWPAALLVSGSGPIDRDGNHKRLRLDIQRQLAAALADAGAATLRYDKRGAGQSGGSFLATGFWDNVDDAAAALAALRSQAGVDADRVLVVGHSEGALVATALAGRGTPLAGLVLLSPAARPGEETLRWQAHALEPSLPAVLRGVFRLMRTDFVAQVSKNHRKIKATRTDVAWVGGQRLNARWFREFLAYDPRADLATITAPVLAATGDHDVQVPPEDLETLAALVPGDVETVLVPDLNHILRHQTGTPTLKTYKTDVRHPVDPRVNELLTSWVTRRVASPA
ncbi:alpha/beta hydrolase [Georgenia thermotolerans]|uniref:Alpha/beta fold hydrolase n=1 Tax=Georgenia thermotolerans TaxID=527326 RepID=A0A7J5UMQ6_9MICO|nr:alpha/beta fold hydrolase [Georgenia thermotolerans]KAE8763659.1 alpha/beta fold hydrolase [Georgenia thermotolerans]